MVDSDRLNRWLTLGANIGVLVGIVLLLIELDQNSDLLRAQIHQARADTHVGHRLNDVESEKWAAISMKLAENGYPKDVTSVEVLTPEELFRFRNYKAARHTDLDNLFYQYQQGYLDEEYYRYRVVCAIRRNASYWQKFGTFRTNSRPSFRAEIERIMREVEWC
jgi:hypothetical protein